MKKMSTPITRIAKPVAAFCLVILSAFLLSCTRGKDSSSSLSLSIPKTMSSQKLGALGTADMLGHVVVNVSGDGIGVPIIFNWDARENGKGTALDKPIQLVVPQGSNRLIQVLAVYMDTQGTTMQFYYGDKVQSFSQANETVSLAVSSISQASSIVSGNISGRYLLSSSAGPTGLVSASYLPSNGRPAVTIDRSVMYNGWFNTFALAGAKFNYTLFTIGGLSIPLFNGSSVDLTEASFPPTANVGRLNIPTSNRQNNGSFGIENPLIQVYGFWGPGASGKSICPYSAPVTTNYRPASNSAGSYAYSAGSLPSDFATSLTLTNIYLQGANGANGTAAPCLSLNNYVDGLNIYTTMADNGKDSAAGFVGPFKASSTGTVFSLTKVDAATYNIAAALLPGALDVVSGINIYKKMGDWDYQDVDCNPQALDGQGFQIITQSLLTSDAWSQNLSVSASDVTNKINLAICPVSRQSGTQFPLGIFVKYYNFGGTPQNQVGVADHITISMQDNLTTFGGGACVPIRFQVRDSLNQNTTPSSSMPYTINLGTGITALYSDSQCVTSMTTAGSFNSNQISGYALIAPASSSGNISITTASLPGTNAPVLVTAASLSPPYQIALIDSETGNKVVGLNRYKCHNLLAQMQMTGGIPAPAPGGESLALAEATVVNYYASSDSSCSSTASSTFTTSGLTSGKTNLPVNLIPRLGLTSLTASLSGTFLDASRVITNSISSAATAIATDVIPAGLLGAGMFNPSDLYLPINQCIPLEMYARGMNFGDRGIFSDIAGFTFTPSTPFQVSSPALVLNNNSGCSVQTASISTATNYLAGDSRSVFYVKSTASQVTTIDVKDTGGSNIMKTVTIHFQ